MDASRYFEEMHRAMSAQKNNSSLLLTVKVQDLGGADAYLELRQSPNGRARVFYSTMGRRNLNFQLFRKGWQLCHNASGEMTGQFPTRAENLLDSADFSACIRDDTLDAGRTEIILRELRRAAGTSRSCLPQSAREGAMITVESFVGRGGEWNYWSTRAADCLPIAAILCWLGDFLAGTERRTLQSSPEAMALAARWQAELVSPLHSRLTASSVLPALFHLPRPAVPRSRCRIPAGRASLPCLQPYENNRRCRKPPAPPVVFCFTVRMRHPPHGPPTQRWSLCPHRRAPG